MPTRNQFSAKKRRRKLWLFGVALIGLAGLYVLIARPPVLVRLHRWPIDAGITVFNPARARGPEYAAEGFLNLLRSREFELAMSGVAMDNRDREVERHLENRYPPTKWRLTDREDQGSKSSLTYAYEFEGGDGELPLFVWLERRNGEWQVVKYLRDS